MQRVKEETRPRGDKLNGTFYTAHSKQPIYLVGENLVIIRFTRDPLLRM